MWHFMLGVLRRGGDLIWLILSMMSVLHAGLVKQNAQQSYITGDIYVIDADTCIDCGACADVCPVDAPQPA